MEYSIRKFLIVAGGIMHFLLLPLLCWQLRAPIEYKILGAALFFLLSVLPLWLSLYRMYKRVSAAQTKAIATGDYQPIRLQFSLWTLFALVTFSAVSCGIACLPIPWPARFGPLSALVVCTAGLALRNYNPKPIP